MPCTWFSFETFLHRLDNTIKSSPLPTKKHYGWPLKMKCNAKMTLRHVIVCNRCGTMPKFQWKNRHNFRDIYVWSRQNHSFPIIFWKHTQGLVPSCDITHDTGNKYSSSSTLLFLSSLHKNAWLWEQSDFEMEFWHSTAWIQTFWLCLTVW